MNETINAIMERFSVRKYTGEKVSAEDQKAILDAGLAAPSAANRQPWMFTVYEDRAGILEMEKFLVDGALAGGDEAAKQRLKDRDYKIFFDAPLLVFVTSKLDGHFDMMDCGIAIQNMVIAAQSLGYGSIVIGGPNGALTGPKGEYFTQLLKFPEGHKFAAAVAIGKPAIEGKPHAPDPAKVRIV